MIRVLISTVMWSSSGLISLMRNNPDNEQIEIYGTNANEASIPKPFLDGWQIVPRYGEDYILALLDYCKTHNIDVVVPTIDIEVSLLSKEKHRFEEIGVKVSVSSPESMEMIGDKMKLGKLYGKYMPEEAFVTNSAEVLEFAGKIGYPERKFCIKLSNSIGGHGFAIVDDDKATDIRSYGVYCGKDYITLEQACKAVDRVDLKGGKLIVQEYIAGTDYSVNVLAEDGYVSFMAGYEAPMIQEGFALYARMHGNTDAYRIVEEIVRETGYDGNACFDFIELPDGSVKLLEVNARINTNHVLVAYAGLNMMWLRIKQLLGENISKRDIKVNLNAEMRRTYQCNFTE